MGDEMDHQRKCGDSYFAASCGGAPLTIVRQYVEDQRKGAHFSVS
jgi:putative transposase